MLRKTSFNTWLQNMGHYTDAKKCQSIKEGHIFHFLDEIGWTIIILIKVQLNDLLKWNLEFTETTTESIDVHVIIIPPKNRARTMKQVIWLIKLLFVESESHICRKKTLAKISKHYQIWHNSVYEILCNPAQTMVDVMQPTTSRSKYEGSC